MSKVCAFTGNRKVEKKFNKEALKNQIEALICDGYTDFLCGMAIGFDSLAAECVIELREKYAVKLIACVPCTDQDKYFTTADKKRYKELLDMCDEVKVLGDRYTSACMFIRNRYMVDNCDIVLCYSRKESGGTHYTVEYAQDTGKKIIAL